MPAGGGTPSVTDDVDLGGTVYFRRPKTTAPAMKLALTLIAGLLPAISFAQMDSLSYNIGILLAKSVQAQGLPVENQDDFIAGFRAVFAGEVSEADLQGAQQAITRHMQGAEEAKSAAAKSEGQAFLEQNKTRPEVTTTASGLQYEVLTPGNGGVSPKATDRVTVHYTGKNLDGSVFDSSVQRGEPTTFPLNGVIAGWTEGVQLMTPGAKYRFYIPSDLAYGDRGAGSDIAPGATLIFDVELISVN